MKRVISLVLAIVLLLSATVIPVAAEGNGPSVSLSVVPVNVTDDGTVTELTGSAPYTKGEYVMLKVTFHNDETVRYLQTAQFAVTYDTDAFSAVQGKDSDDNTWGPGITLIDGWMATSTTPNLGVATFSSMTGSRKKVGSNGSIDMVGFLFKVNESAETGTYRFGFDTTREQNIGVVFNTSETTATRVDADYANTKLDVWVTGSTPKLNYISIVPTTEGNAVYGETKSFALTAKSESGKDITDFVTWKVTDSNEKEIELGYDKSMSIIDYKILTVKPGEISPNAGLYSVTASLSTDASEQSASNTFEIFPKEIETVNLTLSGYAKGETISNDAVSSTTTSIDFIRSEWYKAGSDEQVTGKFEASTQYDVRVRLDPDYNHTISSTTQAYLTDSRTQKQYTADITDGTVDGVPVHYATFNLDATDDKDPATINTLPTASDATYGDILRSVTLTGGAASTEGTFAWTNGDQSVGNATVAGEEGNSFEVTFTPNDADTYANAYENVKVKVNRKSIEDKDVTIDDIPSQSYTGQELQPTPTIKFRGEDLELGTDFTLVYNNNTDCGTATVKIIGEGNFTGEITKTFQITKSINHEDIKVELSNEELVYDGTAKAPTFTVKDGEKVLERKTDYTFSCTNCFNAGLATLTITGIGNYTGEKIVNYTIEPQILSITADKVPNITGVYFYDGTAKTPEVNEMTVGNVTLTKDKDYTVEYNNNINAGDKAEIIIKPKDGSNYTFDPCTKYFSIEKAYLSGVAKEHNVSVRYGDSTERTFSADDVTGLAGKGTFTMSHIQVPDENTIFTYGEFKGLMTYHLKTTKDNVDQTISVQVTFHSDNYEDVTVTLKVTIVGKLDANLMVNGITDKMSMTYGDTKTLTWSVAEAAKGGKIEVTSSAADVIAVEENRTLRAAKVGTAKITVKYETADYYDEAEFNITVNKKPITVTAENMTVVYGDGWDGLAYDIPDDALVGKDSPLSLNIKPETKATSASPVGEYQITLTQAEGANPNYAVTMNPGTLTITKAPLTIESATVKSKEYDGNKTATVTAVEFSGLKNNETLTSSDYTATGEFKDANAGAEKEVGVTVTLNTTGTAANYELKSSTLDAKGTIEKRTTQVRFTEIKNAVYTGKPYARENYAVNSENAVFKFFKADGNSLGEEISAPTDVGKYYITAIVEETANEKLSAVTEGFEITAKSLADDDIAVEAIPDQTYTGEQLKPAVTIKYNGMPLTADKDYTVAYENCTNVGVATAKITGKGNYEGTTTKTFNITAKPVTNAQVTFSENEFVYDGTLKYPSKVTVVVDGKTLTDADFGQSFTNCTNAGTATAIITFNGNYSGEITKTYTIKPKPINDLNWSGSTFFYTGNAHEVTANVKESDLAEVLTTSGEVLETVNVTVKGGKQTAIGTYIATATALDNTNYTLPTDGLTHPFEIKNAIASISVTSPATVSATVDGLTIKLVGTMSEGTTPTLKINGVEMTPVNGKITVSGIEYTVDDSNVVKTPANVALTEDTPAVAPKQDATPETKAAANAISDEATKSEGLAAAAAEAVTNEAASKATGSETITAETKLEIQVESYVPASSATDNKATLTLEITPKVTYTYTDKDGKSQEETKTISNSDIKAPVTISVKLPEGMPTTNLFVKHLLKNGGVEYIQVTVKDGVATWQQSSFSTAILMADDSTATITLVKDNGDQITMTLNRASVGTALPKDGTKTNWQFDGIDGSYSSITNELFEKLAKMPGTVTATSVSGSSSNPDSKPSKPGNSSSGPLLPSLGDDELTFRDVSKYDYYYNAVKWALKKGVTSGTGRYTFSPDAACTRAQTVTFLWRAAGCPKATAKTNPFTDVHTSDYFYEAVLWAVENGITNGTSSTTFSPNASVTRAQVATFLWRANGEPAAKDSGFTDVAANAYYARAVAWAYAEGITTGTGFGVFSPEAICTRAQIVTFLFRNAK